MCYTELRITRWKEATQVQMQSKCISRATVFQKFPDLIPLYRRSFTTLFLHCAKRPSSLPAAKPPPPLPAAGIKVSIIRGGRITVRFFAWATYTYLRKEGKPGRSLALYFLGYPVETITTLFPWAELRMPISLNTVSSTTDSLKSYESRGSLRDSTHNCDYPVSPPFIYTWMGRI